MPRDRAGMMERQTLTSQKRLPERACGFESRSRHQNALRYAARFPSSYMANGFYRTMEPDLAEHKCRWHEGKSLLLVFSTRRTPGSAAYRSPPSGTGAAAAAVSRTALSRDAEPRVHDATKDPWMSQRTYTSWASISAMGTSRAGGETYTCSRSPAATTGRDSWRLPEA